MLHNAEQRRTMRLHSVLLPCMCHGQSRLFIVILIYFSLSLIAGFTGILVGEAPLRLIYAPQMGLIYRTVIRFDTITDPRIQRPRSVLLSRVPPFPGRFTMLGLSRRFGHRLAASRKTVFTGYC